MSFVHRKQCNGHRWPQSASDYAPRSPPSVNVIDIMRHSRSIVAHHQFYCIESLVELHSKCVCVIPSIKLSGGGGTDGERRFNLLIDCEYIRTNRSVWVIDVKCQKHSPLVLLSGKLTNVRDFKPVLMTTIGTFLVRNKKISAANESLEFGHVGEEEKEGSILPRIVYLWSPELIREACVRTPLASP